MDDDNFGSFSWSFAHDIGNTSSSSSNNQLAHYSQSFLCLLPNIPLPRDHIAAEIDADKANLANAAATASRTRIRRKEKNISDKKKCHNNKVSVWHNCQHCCYGSDRSNNLQRHQKCVHGGLREYKCCEMVFTDKTDHEYHTKEKHFEKENSFVCKFQGCNSKFNNKRDLENHQKRVKIGVHTGVSYPCSYCDKSLSNESNRQRHMKTCKQTLQLANNTGFQQQQQQLEMLLADLNGQCSQVVMVTTTTDDQLASNSIHSQQVVSYNTSQSDMYFYMSPQEDMAHYNSSQVPSLSPQSYQSPTSFYSGSSSSSNSPSTSEQDTTFDEEQQPSYEYDLNHMIY